MDKYLKYQTETPNVIATISIANDRVPAVPSVDELLNDKREVVRSNKLSQRESPPAMEQVSASYTIVTPSYLRSRTQSSSGDDREGKVSATYTIASTGITPVVGIASKDKHEIEKKGSHVSTHITSTGSTVTATFNVPLLNSSSNNNNNNMINNTTLKKTDSVENVPSNIAVEKPKSSPTVKSRFKWNEEVEKEKEIDTESKPVPASRFNPDYPVHRYVRDKRSIFDTEINVNNSNLTLAEKLRIEASKYADTSRSSNDLPFTRSDSAESDTSSTTSSVTNKKYDSVPSSPAHHTAERRPSWRLRPDLGSKV